MFSVMSIVGNGIGNPSSNTEQGLFAFHFALMPLGKDMNPSVVSSQLWVNSRANWVLLALVRQPVWKKKKTEFKRVVLSLKIDEEGLSK